MAIHSSPQTHLPKNTTNPPENHMLGDDSQDMSTDVAKYAREDSNPQPSDPKSDDIPCQLNTYDGVCTSKPISGSSHDPDLTQVVAYWPRLDEPIKAGVLALIKTTKPNHPTRNDKEESGPRSL